MSSRALALLALLAILDAAPAVSVCFQGEPNRVARVTVGSCVDLPTFAAGRLERTPLPWVIKVVGDLLEVHNGVVVRGTVTRKLYVTQLSDTDFQIENSLLVEEPGEWFVELEPGTEASCEPYAAGSEVELYLVDKCCDVTPPYDVPCALDTGKASPIPPLLKKML